MGKAVNSFIEKWSGRASNAYTLWPLLPVGIASGMMVYLSTGVTWISQFGAFGWATTGILSFLVLSGATFLAGAAREKFVYAKIAREKAAPGDSVNPIEREFTKKRINLIDLVRPSTSYIKDKTFTDCQLIGPMNVILDGVTISGSGFINCNWAVVKSNITIFNAVALTNVTIRGGDISDLTILVPEGGIEMLRQFPVSPINTTGDAEIDARTTIIGRIS